MSRSTYVRMQRADADRLAHRKQIVEAKLKAANLSSECGGYPVNPDEFTAYNAGFQRGCHWASQDAFRGQAISERWDMADSTAAGCGEQDGWNAVVHALAEEIDNG